MILNRILGKSNSTNNPFVQYAEGTLSSFTSNVSYIKNYAFTGCALLSKVSCSVCTTIGQSAFYQCYSLTTANFPACTNIGNDAFQQCFSLTTISFPECTTIGGYAFAYCSELTTANFPACTNIGGSAFASCSALTTASFPMCEVIGSSAFRNCYSLISLYLTSVTSIPTLGDFAFISTPIGGYSTSAGRYGSVYVPSSLYASFTTASNWSAISSRIVSIY